MCLFLVWYSVHLTMCTGSKVWIVYSISKKGPLYQLPDYQHKSGYMGHLTGLSHCNNLDINKQTCSLSTLGLYIHSVYYQYWLISTTHKYIITKYDKKDISLNYLLIFCFDQQNWRTDRYLNKLHQTYIQFQESYTHYTHGEFLSLHPGTEFVKP